MIVVSALLTICSYQNSAWLSTVIVTQEVTRPDYYSNCLLGFVEEDADVEWQESWIEKKKGKV